jgi:hypothetical protein
MAILRLEPLDQLEQRHTKEALTAATVPSGRIIQHGDRMWRKAADDDHRGRI